MTQLYNRYTDEFSERLTPGEVAEYIKEDEWDYYAGENGQEIPIHMPDPNDPANGLGRVETMTPQEAKTAVLEDGGTYFTADETTHWLNKRDYGDDAGSTAAAAALGASGALTLGILPAVAGLVSDEAAGIMDANPKWMMASDILTTIWALSLAPKTLGASTLLGGGALGRLGSRLGLKTLLAAANKSPLKKLAQSVTVGPRAVHRAGQKVEAKVAERFLKDAAEEQLKSSAARGLLPRMAGFGTEALIYSAGYNLPQAINDKLEGRSWGDVATAYGLQMGMGTTIGLALPAVFGGLLGGALGVAGAVGRNYTRPIKWVLNTEMAKRQMKNIAEGAADLNPDTIYSRTGKKFNTVELLTTAHKEDSASKQMLNFGKQLGEMVKKTVGFLGQEFKNEKVIRSVDQAGHRPSVVKEWVKEIPATSKDSADPFVLADQMLNGNFGRRDTGLSIGLIPTLRNLTQELPPHARGSAETKGILADLDILENSILEWVRKITLKEFNPGALTGLADTRAGFAEAAKRFNSWIGKPARKTQLKSFEEWIKRYGKSEGLTEEQRIIVAHLSIDDWRHHGSAVIDEGRLSEASADFITDMFVKLEQLSARVHATGGAAAASDATSKWAGTFKRHITEMLSNTGKTWSVADGPTAFGLASVKKNSVNQMFKARDMQHKTLWGKFHSPDPDSPYAGEIDPAKVESLLRNITQGDKKNSAEMLGAYARKNFDLLDYLEKNYDIRGFEGPIKDAVNVSRDARHEIGRHLELMKTEMADALEWSAIMNADNKLSQASTIRSLLPGSVGTGLIRGLGAGGIAAAMGGHPALVGAAGLATGLKSGLGRARYDAMSNPGRAMVTINKFFMTANKNSESVTGEVNRYFTWLNKAGTVPGTSRLTYLGPGSDKYGRYPRAITSKVIGGWFVKRKKGEIVSGEAFPWAGELESYTEEK